MDGTTRAIVVVTLVVGLATGASALGTVFTVPDHAGTGSPATDLDPAPTVDGKTHVAQFENRSAFRRYLREGRRLADGASPAFGFRGNATRTVSAPMPEAMPVDVPTANAMPAAGDGSGSESADAPSRIGDTNVQVAGLDEPDLVKTDGRNFYYSPRVRPVGIEPPVVGVPDGKPERDRPNRGVSVVDASDPSAPERIAGIDDSGRLLRAGDTLVVLGHDAIVGYDVSDAANPSHAWTRPLNASVVTARERNGTLYLVTETRVDPATDCPIEPLGENETIACSDVYRPDAQIPADATYSTFAIDATSGAVRDRVSFVGTAENTVVYMSPDALYLAYTVSTPRVELLETFLRGEFDRTPEWLADEVATIRATNASAWSQEREIRRAVTEWIDSLPETQRDAVRESLRSGFSAYVATHQRNLTRTGIVRVGVGGDALSVGATGDVPGRPLNQFSMSQHEGTLRITTTVPRAVDTDSENDLYTLDATTLERGGNVTGMGAGQEVYAVRYVGDTAYVVTFRRIDPLHVVDLSDPDDPEEIGELELPGFSTYLHPIDDGTVLGIGEEEGQVKAVLFDVSDPANPTVADDRILEEHWSAISESHHAFTIDRRHGVFFLPAGDSGVVMDYTNASLSVETSIATEGQARRARYVEDYLYVFADRGITVVDETTWEETARLDLSG